MNEMTTLNPLTRTPQTGAAEPFVWLRQEIDRLFDGFGRPVRAALDAGWGSATPLPAIEMTENADSYRLTAELPGLDRDDIAVSVVDGILTLSGEMKNEREEKDRGFMLRERRYGAFERQIALPADADPDNISAKVKRGVLTIVIAKDAGAASRVRKIDIEKE